MIGTVSGSAVYPTRDFLKYATESEESTTETSFYTGDVRMTLAEGEESGWLTLNGQTVSKSTYSALYVAIAGSITSETETTFNLPDLRNLIPIGAGTIANLGGTAGAGSVTLSTANLPPHSHEVTEQPHTHTAADKGHVHGGSAAAVGTGTNDLAAGTDIEGIAHTGRSAVSPSKARIDVSETTTGVSVGSTGEGVAVSIIPPVVGVNWMVKT